MTENFMILPELVENVIVQLKEQHYMDSTIAVYRRFYGRVDDFMKRQGVVIYTKKLGEDFLNATHVCSSTMKAYECATRRLNDYVEGKPYRCHHGNPSEDISGTYLNLLDGYLEKCIKDGNKTATIACKKKACTLFLNYIEQAGYTQISALNTEITTKVLLIYTNKDNYAIIRLFLRYLSQEGYTVTDLSGIVPHYKRRSVLPTTYTVDEILKIENTVDMTTDTGKRDLAIIRLATRMGLRSGDIAKLNLNEVDFKTGFINIIQEKTGQPLSLQMPIEVSKAITLHFENSKPNIYEDGYLFHSMYAPYGRITTSIIRHTVTNHMNSADIDISGRKHGPHVFRSSLASSMVNDGISYESVRKILGHSDPDVIKHYAKTDIEHLRLCALEAPVPKGIFNEYLSGRRMINLV